MEFKEEERVPEVPTTEEGLDASQEGPSLETPAPPPVEPISRPESPGIQSCGAQLAELASLATNVAASEQLQRYVNVGLLYVRGYLALHIWHKSKELLSRSRPKLWPW